MLMKGKITLIATLLFLLAAGSASAQSRRHGGYIPPAPRQGHGVSTRRGYHFGPNTYYGFRFGLSASHISSDAPELDGSSSKTGLNVGAVVGIQLAPQTPLFFETGLGYSEKGGKGNFNGEKFSIGLNYLEVPLLLKYSAYVAPATAVEPFVGGYLSCGVGGKVKDYGSREAFSSFDDRYGANFKRFDGGLRVGCGLAYEMLYAEIGYDFGLTNIGDNAFDDTHNGALFLNVGINF
jgi:hypothetical protein